jgi:glycosyltransferase involved in cell wall biosynthesis
MNDIRLTVLMPVFNAEKYIAEAILSVLEQSFAHFELLIVNDGSTDKTSAVIKQFTDPRIRLLELPRSGISTALNTGLTAATGYYIARFDADDICLPGRLAKQISFLDKNPGHVLVGCEAEYITESGEHLFNFQCSAYTHEAILQQLYTGCPFIHSGVMFRKEPVMEAGAYSSDAHTFEDYLLWVQLVKYGKYANLPERLLKVRFNPSSATMDEKWRGHRFRRLKKTIIRRGMVAKEQGEELLAIIRKQNDPQIMEAAYYALCGKKFLVNNYQPAKARANLVKAISHCPRRLDNYMLYLVSFFPPSVIGWLHPQKTAKI